MLYNFFFLSTCACPHLVKYFPGKYEWPYFENLPFRGALPMRSVDLKGRGRSILCKGKDSPVW
ncbi:hypothetical protein PCYB_081560 [Plasmodium cynomolgi strain B]|uniref:Uncharacterized protein n=1 Tax=Plasmodium cynomolgi (strain B) TaxID=1120755 RepID=K6UUX2_PLACD|nr:hypothetical protein PCYB_081560 [Plasmodium cynomolgi strain B]GAB65995.1 hypothetical protein PCYB_081560 [Plasmodium cynomolgi strain B]